MKVLVIHNRYLEKGGEDGVVQAEKELLTRNGHKVILYEKSNESIENLPFFRKVIFFLRDLNFSKAVYGQIREIVKREKPDIAHVHNIFLCVTPSVYLALRDEGVPVVQSLHNYRFFCIRGSFFDGRSVCEKCKDKQFFNAIIKKCWRNSFFISCCFVRLLFKTRSFLKYIDSYIATSRFSRDKFIQLGLNKERIFLKVNFAEIEPEANSEDRNYALFLGRLVDYKGVETLLKAYKIDPSYNLKIIGDGPLESKIQSLASSHGSIELMGRIERQLVLSAIKNSSFVIFPSECYENMPLVLIESFAHSKPVIASNLGAIREFVIDGVNGILFEPGNERDLAAKISYLFSHKKERVEMGKAAGDIYRERFDRKKNYQDLMNIYSETIKIKREASKHG